MTPAEEIRRRAHQIEGMAWDIRWTSPRTFRQLTQAAAEMREIADHLPPPPRSQS